MLSFITCIFKDVEHIVWLQIIQHTLCPISVIWWTKYLNSYAQVCHRNVWKYFFATIQPLSWYTVCTFWCRCYSCSCVVWFKLHHINSSLCHNYLNPPWYCCTGNCFKRGRSSNEQFSLGPLKLAVLLIYNCNKGTIHKDSFSGHSSKIISRPSMLQFTWKTKF